jgi:hypothetical protein
MKFACHAAVPTRSSLLLVGPLIARARPRLRGPRFDEAVFKVGGEAKEVVIEIKVAK